MLLECFADPCVLETIYEVAILCSTAHAGAVAGVALLAPSEVRSNTFFADEVLYVTFFANGAFDLSQIDVVVLGPHTNLTAFNVRFLSRVVLIPRFTTSPVVIRESIPAFFALIWNCGGGTFRQSQNTVWDGVRYRGASFPVVAYGS